MKNEKKIIIDIKATKKEERNISGSQNFANTFSSQENNDKKNYGKWSKENVFYNFYNKSSVNKKNTLIGSVIQIILICIVGVSFFLILIFTLLFSLAINVIRVFFNLFFKKQ